MLQPDRISDTNVGSFRLTTVADYEDLVGGETVDRILAKAQRLSDLHVVNVSATYSPLRATKREAASRRLLSQIRGGPFRPTVS